MSSIDEVRDIFRVRVAAKDNSRTTELALQFDMVLDNAVVNNRHIAGQVGMSILLARAAMSGPSSVSDTYGAVERAYFQARAPIDPICRRRARSRSRHPPAQRHPPSRNRGTLGAAGPPTKQA